MATTAEYQIGQELPPLTTTMTLATMSTPFMGGGNPIHYDQQFAESVSLPGPIATGMISSGYLSRVLTAAFGLAWITTGRFKATFVKPIFADDTVMSRARITSREAVAGGIRLGLDVWCENQRGETVLAGTASVLLGSPT